MRFLAALLLVFAGITLVGAAAPANADLVCHTEEEVIELPGGGVQTIVKEVCVEDGEPGGPDNGTVGCSYDGKEIPCSKLGFTWFSSQGCYATNVSAAMPADKFKEYWQGHTDGSLWQCQGQGPDMINTGSPFFFWMPGPPPVDGRVLAQKALDGMSLVKPSVHMAPRPPLMTYVGLETWLWMDEGQWSGITGGASVPTASVAVTATPVRVTWDLTENTTTCASAGRAWVTGMSSDEETDCSYAFQQVSDFQPDEEYPVTATLTYQVDWTCTGNCIAGSGSLGEVSGATSDPTYIRVGERQSVVIR